MTDKPLKNIPASIRQRLLNLARERHDEFGLILTNYAIERWLARLSQSAYADQFILKGAQLFPLWMDTPHRPTRDLDLLRQGESDVQHVVGIFRDVCALEAEPPDGIIFLPETINGAVIREDSRYEGVRITLDFILSGARDYLQVDIGVGDAVVPRPDVIEMPSMLGFSPVRLCAYPKETVIAEKLEAMVSLGIGNSRMKDFYDLWMLSRMFPFTGVTLSQAVAATFERRQTVVPTHAPLALTNEFWNEATKQAQWRAFLKRLRLDDSAYPLERIITDLQRFLLPVLQALANGRPAPTLWTIDDGWHADGAEKPA